MPPFRPSDRPTKRELDEVTEKIRPALEELFHRHGVSPMDAERLLWEALVRLSYQWDRIRSREWWLLDTLEKEAGRLSHPSREESEHE